MSANLFKRGETWWARAQVRGKDHRRNLRTTSKVEAKRRLKAYLAEIDHFFFYGEERHTWKDAVVAWGETAPDKLRPQTIERYVVSLGQIDHLLNGLYLDDINKKLVAQIASRPGISNATRRRDMTAASQVLRLAEAKDWIEVNPFRLWDRSIIPEKREPIALPPLDHIAAMVDAAPGTLGYLIRTLQYTGMRKKECTLLERHEIDWDRKAINLTKTKTKRPRSVPMDERVVGTITGTPMYAHSTYVFWHGEGKPHLRASSQFGAMRKRVNRSRAKEGLPKITFRLHDLRHWYAVDYLRRGGSMYDLQQHLGHSSLSTTEIYTDFLTPEEEQKAKRVGTKPGTGTTV